MKAKLYIHCGLHKTGTTALQQFLVKNRERLASVGLHVPKAGCFNEKTTHHNLAWELTRDRRFERAKGGMAALREELAGTAGDVVLSSEDFESLLRRPAAWEPLVRLAADTGRRLVLVVYVQHQANYLEGLYLQSLRSMIAEEFSAFAEEALETGVVRRREWIFQFDHARALDGVSQVDCELVVRNYHQLVGGSIVPDFLGVVGAPDGLFTQQELARRTHRRRALDQYLTLFYQWRMVRQPSPRELLAMRWMAADLPEPKAPTPLLTQFADAFRVSNRRVCERFRVPEQGLVAPGPPPNHLTDLARVFSLETQATIHELARRLPDNQPTTGQLRVNPESRSLHARWTAWVTDPDAPRPDLSPADCPSA